MRILNLSSVTTVASAATTNGTATDFTAAPRKNPFFAGASAVLALQIENASAATVAVQTSTDGGSTFATAQDDNGSNISVVLTGAVTKTNYYNVPNIGEQMRLQVVTAGTTAGTAGVIAATLVQN